MIVNVFELSEEQKIQMVISGLSYAMSVAYDEKKMYEDAKSGNLTDISVANNLDIKILSLLEGLGYPMDELGTYLYKDVIAEVYEKIKDVSGRRDMEECRSLMGELNDAYSNFYRWIARDDKELGVTSFHFYITKALEQVDKDKIDDKLFKSVFGKQQLELNYGLQAFQLAAYIAECYTNDVENVLTTSKESKVKMLFNTPIHKFK